MTVRADRQRRARIEPRCYIGQSVTEIRLSRGADYGAGTALCDAIDFLVRHVRRMHQLPALIQSTALQQPLHRAQASHPLAFVHFGHLLGDMDVDRPVGTADQARDGCLTGRAQGVNRHARIQRRLLAVSGLGSGGDAPLCGEHPVGTGGKTALVVAQRRRGKPRALVENGQQRKSDTRLRCGIGQRPRHQQRIFVLATILIVMQVVKFADVGVAAAQQLGVEFGGDRAQSVRRHRQRNAIHAVAPAPEVVMLVLAAFGEPGERPLESMAVGIDHTG